jgi:hypothetical protein
MELSTIKTKKLGESIKDTKGQKLVAAVFLVTAHLSDTSALKTHMRDSVLCLIKEEGTRALAVARALTTILEGAAYAKEISSKNASIISYEVSRYIALEDTHADTVVSMFELETVPPKMSFSPSSSASAPQSKRLQKDTTQKSPEFVLKSQRKEDIMSFINSRSMTTLKDIQNAYPTLSEKTIQRDLAVLVSDGDIAKQGSKRWSLYLPK